MKIDPPGLPDPLVDDATDTIERAVASSWDALAATAIECHYSTARYDNRVRVTWMRFSLVHWCCWRRMRIGAVDTQPKNRTFGWERHSSKFAACQKCGRIKGYLL
jgi:hypothetical protein